MNGTRAFPVRILRDIDEISHEAAKLFVTAAERCISSREQFAVAVSGGSTPIKLFTLLRDEYADRVDWARVNFFWVDERCLPIEDKGSNFKGAWDVLLSHIDIPEGNIHRIGGEVPPGEGASEYEDELKRFFGADKTPEFDLVFLGMGEDGHTASLFPGSDSLKESERFAVPVYVERLKSWRVTLTLPVLNNAHGIVFLVAGRNKAGVLKDVLDNKGSKYPAGLIKPDHGSLIWLVDEDAAVEIKKSHSSQ